MSAEVPHYGVAGTKDERTFIAIKPDGVQRTLVGAIIARFEQKGYQLMGLKMLTPSKEQAQTHYIDLASKPFYGSLVDYFSSGPIVAMCWSGLGVIKGGRTLLGATNPADSLPGTIRGDFAVEVGRNICHGSDSADAAKTELSFWFKPDEISNWNSVFKGQVYEKI
jgi:nucleoside-diphosphate kinase